MANWVGAFLSLVFIIFAEVCVWFVCLFVPWFSSHLCNVPMVAQGLLRKSFPYLERMSSSDRMAAGHAVCMAMVENVLQLTKIEQSLEICFLLEEKTKTLYVTWCTIRFVLCL